jgi:hypothetical protein
MELKSVTKKYDEKLENKNLWQIIFLINYIIKMRVK